MKMISRHDYKIMYLCKNNVEKYESVCTLKDKTIGMFGKSNDTMLDIQDYLRIDYLANVDYLSYNDLYRFLIKTAEVLLTEREFYNLLRYGIVEKISNNVFWEKRENITSKELCHLVIVEIMQVVVREQNESGEWEELFQMIGDV